MICNGACPQGGRWGGSLGLVGTSWGTLFASRLPKPNFTALGAHFEWFWDALGTLLGGSWDLFGYLRVSFGVLVEDFLL